MTADMTTVNAILKEVYAPRIVDQMQSERVAIKRIEKSSEGVTETTGGKYVDIPIKVGRNHGQGYRNELEQLPSAGRQKYAELHTGLKYGYGRVRLSGQVMQLAEKNYQAFASAMDREMNGLKDDLQFDENRVVYGDGSGLMATITSTTASSTTQTVDDVMRLEIGMMVDVLTISSGATVVLDTEITDVDPATNTVTFADAFTGATTAGIFRQGSYGREPNGLSSIVDDSTALYGLDPATERKWAAVVDDNGGTNRALSEALMISMADKVRINGGKTSLILQSLGVRRAYFNLLTQQRRYTDTKKYEGGLTGLAFNYGTEVPVVEDVAAPKNTQYFLDESEFKIYQNKDWHWADEDGNTLKWVNDYDAWEGIMRKYWEIGCNRRNAQGVVKDITEG